jgi:hypothetical protein
MISVTHPGERSVYERFAIPFAFKPQLSFVEAVIGTFAAFLRIVLGSVLFAMWGTCILEAWSHIHNLFLRAGVLLALGVLGLLAFALLMFAISFLGRALHGLARGGRTDK